MQPIDHSELKASGPSSFEQRLQALYGDSPEAPKPLDVKLILGLLSLGAVSFWGGVLWLTLRVLARHA